MNKSLKYDSSCSSLFRYLCVEIHCLPLKTLRRCTVLFITTIDPPISLDKITRFFRHHDCGRIRIPTWDCWENWRVYHSQALKRNGLNFNNKECQRNKYHRAECQLPNHIIKRHIKTLIWRGFLWESPQDNIFVGSRGRQWFDYFETEKIPILVCQT